MFTRTRRTRPIQQESKTRQVRSSKTRFKTLPKGKERKMNNITIWVTDKEYENLKEAARK